MRHLVSMLSIPVLCLGLAGGGQAGSATATMPVSLTIGSGTSASCAVTASSLDFGLVNDPAATAAGYLAQATINVNCGTGTAYNISLDGGLAGTRAFRSGGIPVVAGFYNLYKDSGHTQVWGDSGFGNTFTSGTPQAATGTGANQTYTVFGATSFTSPPPVGPGTYTDTVTVTVNF